MKHLFLAKFYQFLYFATDLRFRKDQIEFGDIKALQQFGFGKIWKYILGILPFYLREFGEVTAELWTKLKTLPFPGLLDFQHRRWNMMTINVELACRFGRTGVQIWFSSAESSYAGFDAESDTALPDPFPAIQIAHVLWECPINADRVPQTHR